MQAHSNFSLRIIGFSSRGAAIVIIRLLSNSLLAFKYNDERNLVVIDTFNEYDLSFQFELLPPNPLNILFVDQDNNRYCAS